MKKIVMFLVISLVGMFAHAEMQDFEPLSDEVNMSSRLWGCGLAFKGSSKGVKVIVGHFSTVAWGVLKCHGINGKHYSRNVKITIGHHWVGPTVGVGYFKLAGASSEISLFNSSPNVILGRYKVVQADAAIIGGAGAFTAVKVGLPQLAVNISLKLLKGIGVHVGIDKMKIEAVN